MLNAVILAGGTGTRLWPLTRTDCPKQFLQLLGPYTLLQQTVLRLSQAVAPHKIWIVCGEQHESLIRSQLASLPAFQRDKLHFVAEPSPRNTAAAIGLAAAHLLRTDPQAVMAVLPADHWIEKETVFVSLLENAATVAQRGVLVTLGIIPDRPDTGYGYICRGARFGSAMHSSGGDLPVYRVERFAEKPDLPTAEQYVASRQYYWNAGIFVWRPSAILNEIRLYLPALYDGLIEIAKHLDLHSEKEITKAVYRRLEAISIDYGVLEKSRNMVVVPADIGWSDLGDWSTIHRLSKRDERGNAFTSKVVNVDSKNTFVLGNGRLIATIGLHDTVIVDTNDALLICSNERVQEVKSLAAQLQLGGLEQELRTVHRPWGSFTILGEGAGFKAKRISVNPGAALSLQLHRHRNEHWVIVAGVAQATIGERECQLEVGKAAYVPIKTRHRLTNPGAETLEVIEVQTGTYLGEDDIIRFEDQYGRA